MVNIEISDNERHVIDQIRQIERSAYHSGFADGKRDAEEKAEAALEAKLRKAYLDGKAKAYREIQIGKFMEETDKILWIPGDSPEEEGEYLVTTEGISTPIPLHYADGEWQMPKKSKHVILAYRRMPARYEKEN